MAGGLGPLRERSWVRLHAFDAGRTDISLVRWLPAAVHVPEYG